MTLHCAVVIRVRNASTELRQLLPRLGKQEGVRLSLVVVDNASTDDTAEYALSCGARVIAISDEEFTWGRALNRGLACVEQEVALVLSADVLPLSNDWATVMTESVLKGSVAAVYGKQVPYPDAPLDEWLRVRKRFPDGSIEWTHESVLEISSPNLIASNSCAAIRMSVWRELPFDEDMMGTEERPWAREAMLRGGTIRYCAEVSVSHSHKESAMRQARRLWELHVQSLHNHGRSVRFADVLHATGVFAKRRLVNVGASDAPLSKRIAAALRLPWEAAALLWVGASAHLTDSHGSVHRKW